MKCGVCIEIVEYYMPFGSGTEFVIDLYGTIVSSFDDNAFPMVSVI